MARLAGKTVVIIYTIGRYLDQFYI